jgi:hypothetical protein
VRWLPSQMTRSRLAPSAPTIAPTVFAAYTPPTRRPGSVRPAATEASASGKLAPHRIAAGRIAQSVRTMSSWNVNQGLLDIDGSMGQ